MKKKKNPVLIGCGSILGVLVVGLTLILVIGGINQSSDSASKDKASPILDVEQFSLVNQAFVKEKLGEPESFEDINYQTPSTGANNLLTYFYYNWNGYYSEFTFDDKDRLIRISIYPSDNKESKFVKTTFEDLLKQLGITPGENLAKVADTGAAWRYQRVSDKIDEVWALDELGQEDKISIIKISFDVRPFL